MAVILASCAHMTIALDQEPIKYTRTGLIGRDNLQISSTVVKNQNALPDEKISDDIEAIEGSLIKFGLDIAMGYSAIAGFFSVACAANYASRGSYPSSAACALMALGQAFICYNKAKTNSAVSNGQTQFYTTVMLRMFRICKQDGAFVLKIYDDNNKLCEKQPKDIDSRFEKLAQEIIANHDESIDDKDLYNVSDGKNPVLADMVKDFKSYLE